MDRKQLAQELETLSPEQRAWFAGRCALRALPLLAYRGMHFPYWKAEDVPRHLFSVFRAINVAWARSFLRKVFVFATAADDAAAAARAAAADADDVAARAAAYAAAVDAAVDAIDAYAYAYARAAYTSAAPSFSFSDADDADLTLLKMTPDLPARPVDLWSAQPDESWLESCQMLDKGLREVGLAYWADELQRWLKGEFDEKRIERCLNMPKIVIREGVDSMLEWLVADGQVSRGSLDGGLEAAGISDKEHALQQQAVRIAELEKNNQHLQQALDQAGLSEEARQQLEQEKAALTDLLDQQKQRQQIMDQELQAARHLLQMQQEALSGRIDESIKAISDSLVSADSQIKNHRYWSGVFRRMALGMVGLALAAIVWTLCAPPDPGIFGKEAHTAFYLLHVSPLLLLLLMAATLLRHDAKLMQELRELIRQKQQIERLTGLYKASQYARLEVEDSRKLAEALFDKIADHLLALQDGKSEESKPAEQGSDDSMSAILKTLTELIGSIKSKG